MKISDFKLLVNTYIKTSKRCNDQKIRYANFKKFVIDAINAAVDIGLDIEISGDGTHYDDNFEISYTNKNVKFIVMIFSYNVWCKHEPGYNVVKMIKKNNHETSRSVAKHIDVSNTEKPKVMLNNIKKGLSEKAISLLLLKGITIDRLLTDTGCFVINDDIKDHFKK